MNEKYLLELVKWIREELKVALKEKDFVRVSGVVERIDQEIGKYDGD